MPGTREQNRPRIVVISGPTAAGKSARAIEWAERFAGEIVNADSQQVYRYMDVGTAKATPEQRRRVPHHLLDVVAPDEPYHAARFEAEACAAIAGIHARGRTAFVVGGSGLYIKALLEGISTGVGRDPELRQELEAEHARAVAEGDPARLHRRLLTVDPATAAKLHPNDEVRLVRALEIHRQTGRPASAFRRKANAAARFDALHLALDPGREELRERIERRCEAMIEGGLLQEVRALRRRGYGPELASMRAIGYRHMQPVLDGAETLAGVLTAMKQDTRHFARRQRAWLRALQCFHPDTGRSAAAGQIARFLGAKS